MASFPSRGTPRARRAQACHSRAARRRLEREGHRRLPAGAPLDRPQGPEALGRGGRGGSRGQAPREAARRPQGGPEGHRGRQAPPAQPQPRRLPGPCRPCTGGHPPQPEDLRAHPRHQPRPLRPGQAEGAIQGAAGDAVRGLPQAPVLDSRCPLHRRLQARRQGLRGLRTREPQPRDPRERFDPHPGPRLLPLGAVRRRRALRIARGAGDRRRRDLQGQAGQGRLRGPRDPQGGDRAGPTVAVVH